MLQDTSTTTKTRIRLSVQNVALALTIFAVAGGIVMGLFAFPVRKHVRPYQPIAPIQSEYARIPVVNTSERKEKLPYSSTEFLVVFAPEVSDPKAVVQELLADIPSIQLTAKRAERAQAELAKAQQLLATVTKKSHFQEQEEAALARDIPKVPSVTSVAPLFPDLENAVRVKDEFSERFARGGGTAKPSLENWQTVTLDAAVDIPDVLARLQRDGRVRRVALNKIHTTATEDPYLRSTGSWGQPFPDLWGHQENAMNVIGAWAREDGDPGVVIAVSDSGVDYNHEDMAANVWTNPDEVPDGLDNDGNGLVDDIRGYDFTTCQRFDYFGCAEPKPRDNDPMDDNGHGSHVAGTIAAVKDNGVGIAGVCPRCRVMAVKGLNPQGSGYSDDLAQTIYYAAREGADVINMSWGGYGTDVVIRAALDYAWAAGVTLVAAAGNDGGNANYVFPASYLNAETVAATGVNDAPAYFSNYGSVVDIAAPGMDTLSLRAAGTDPYGDGRGFVPPNDPNAKYLRLSGTSMAAPHIAGLYGLLYAKGRTRIQATSDIHATAEDANASTYPGRDDYLGNGRANALGAVNIDGQSPALVDIFTPTGDVDYFERNATVTITGMAAGSQFGRYTVEYAPSWRTPAQWSRIVESSTPVSGQPGDQTLAT